MKRMLARVIPALALCLPALASGQTKLLLTTVVVSPTQAETVAIYNPNASAVDLSNYYLSDYHGYYRVVTPGVAQSVDAGAILPSTSDFIVRFPDGASIAAGETQWIAIGGAECFKHPEGDAGVGSNGCSTGTFAGYGVLPTYEIFTSAESDNASVPNMRDPNGVTTNASSKGLTNGGEPVILFFWDGNTALVTDIDYCFVGSSTASNASVDKSGITIAGPAGSGTYANDIADNTAYHAPIASPNPDAGVFGVNGSCRSDFTEGSQIQAGGNGVNGSNEPSEPTSTTWYACLNAGPSAAVDAGTPGFDASEPGLDAAEPGFDAAQPGFDAAQPGLDAAQPGLDAFVPFYPDAAEPGFDAAQPGPDAEVITAPDATTVEPGPDATTVEPGPDAEVITAPDATAVEPGPDASAVEPGPDAATEEEPADASASKKDAGKKADTGTTESDDSGCGCSSGSGFSGSYLFGLLALGLVARRKRS